MAKKFYAQKDALGFPIQGTLQSTPYAKVPVDTLEIPAADTTVLPGQTAKKHPGSLRYFIRKDRQGNIIANSLTVSLVRPQGLVYEFKLVSGAALIAPSGLTYSFPANFNVGDTLTPASPTLAAGDSPVTYSVSPSLPAGVTLNASTGVISGTTTGTAGVVTYTITATNVAGATTTTITFGITGGE